MSEKQYDEYDQKQHFKVILTPTLDEFIEQSLDGSHLFTFEIMSLTLPYKWKCSNIDKYDGSSNPSAHLKAYMTQANLFTNDFEVNCRFFQCSSQK